MFLIMWFVLKSYLVNYQYCCSNSRCSVMPLLAWNAPLPASHPCSQPLSLNPGIQVKRLKLLLPDDCTEKACA